MGNKAISGLIIDLWIKQLGLLASLVVLGWFSGWVHAYSALVGGIIFILPNAYFALCAFHFQGAKAAVNMLRSMYQGETGKFMLTLVGFASAFTLLKPVSIAVLFLAYFALLASQWLIVSRW